MRRWAPVFLLLAACHSKKTDDVPPPAAASAARVAPAPAPLPSVSLQRLGPRESSGLVLARVDSALRAFVADEDDQAIVEIDPESKAIVRATKINERPRDLLVLADGRLAATLPEAGVVAVYARDTAGALAEAARVKTPSEPLAMAVDAKDATLYVTTGASHSLVSYVKAGEGYEEQRRVSLGREPRAVLVHGDRAFVTHAIEELVSVVEADGAVTTVNIDNRSSCAEGSHCTAARTARHAQSLVRFGQNGIVVPAAQVMPVPARGFSKRALCPPLGRFVGDEFVPDDPSSKLGRKRESGYGFGDEENGPPVTSDLTVIDASAGKKWATGNPPGLGVDCMQPRAAAVDGKSILVACLGSSRVLRYSPSPAPQMHWGEEIPLNFEAKGKAPWPSYPNGIVPNLTASKIEVPRGPSALAVSDEGDAFVWSSFARELTRIRANAAERIVDVPRTVPLAREWLAGRELFFANNDAHISKDGRACASCHIDGADDGLTWKTPDGPRRTRPLRGELASGPYGWMGEHETLKEHVEITLKNLKGKGLPDDDLANLLTFVSQMKKPKLQPAADVERGQRIFASAECSHCHTAGSTDRQVHDVGTGGSFLTPTLASAGTRRALLHDGRFKNLDELLAGTPNMGRGAELGADDRKALEAYLETL